MEGSKVVTRSPRRRWLAGCLFLLAGIVAVLAAALALREWLPGRQAPDATQVAGTAPAETGEPAEQAEAPETGTGSMWDAYRIALVDPDGRLGTVNADGSDRRVLTGEDAVLLFPAWSPDGQRLAAVGSNPEGPGVFTVDDAVESSITPVYVNRDGAPVYLYWSPNGEMVSFIANHEEGFGLYLAPASGDGETRLLATGAPFYWDWSVNGEQVLVHSGASGEGSRIAFVDVAAGTVGDDLGSAGFFQVPGISSDGRYLAWGEVDEAGSRSLVVRDGETGEATELPHRGSIAMSWSPAEDSSQLAFISPGDAGDQPSFSYYGPLRLFDASSGVTEVLAQQVVLAFFWAPSGEHIAYITLANSGEGVQVAADQPARIAFRRRSRATAQHESLQLTLWVAEVSTGQSRQLITFRPTNIYFSQFLPFFDQYALSHQIWSPDGTALVLPIAGATAREDAIYVVPVSGSSSFEIASGNIAFWRP
jgi:TolB protein